MKVPRWLWGLNLVGQIAVANLTCFGLCGLLVLLLFPDGVVHVDHEPAWKRALTYLIPLTTFPVGWLGLLLDPWAAIVLVPLNGYFWGYVGTASWRLRRKKVELAAQTLHLCPGCSAQYSVAMLQCPDCRAPAPARVTPRAEGGAKPSIVFILLTGVVAPIVCGAIALALLADRTIFGVVVGAGFILLMIRWINRHDDPRRLRHPVANHKNASDYG